MNLLDTVKGIWNSKSNNPHKGKVSYQKDENGGAMVKAAPLEMTDNAKINVNISGAKTMQGRQKASQSYRKQKNIKVSSGD